jgi:predicted ATPase
MLGRGEELAQVVGRLEDHRLVTVVGPGGIGKTTLAREVATTRAEHYPLGAHFVDLTLVDDSSAVGGAVAAQLGFPTFTALVDSPTDQPALLVIDNCEHVLDEAAEVVDAVLSACDSPTIVATSRSPLDLPGESVVALGPLRDDTDAAQLFLDRARDAGTELGDEHRESILALCHALDGHPLALELAAARTRVLTPAQILERLGDLDTLARRTFRGAERHRTLRATIEWSYVQLDPADQQRFDRLGVLAGPFTAGTAAAVAGADLDDLDTLVHTSLLVTEPADDGTRFRFLHPLRTFALERLHDRDEATATWQRFADHTIDASRLAGYGGRQAWRAGGHIELMALADDLLATLRWAVAHDDGPDRALAALGVLWGVIHNSRVEDVAAAGEQVLARWPEPAGADWAEAMATLVTCRHLLGRAKAAVDLADHTRRAGPVTGLAACTLPRALARARTSLGDLDGAEAAFAEAVVEARAHGLAPLARESATFHAVVIAAQDLDGALAELDEIDAEATAESDELNRRWVRIARGNLLLATDPAQARTVLADALADSRRVDYGAGVITALQGLVLAELQLGEDATATTADLLEEATHGGATVELRGVLRAAAVLLQRRGDDRWADLAATADRLPSISTFAGIGPRLFPLPDGGGRPLTASEAVASAREALTAPPPRPAEPATETAGRFRREGDVWLVGWAGTEVRVRASKGMADLAALLARPGRDVHCLELAGAGAEESSTGESIDAEARRAYEQRIRDLQAEIDEAEAHHDHARAEKAQVEFDAVVEHLTTALGLGGRARRGGSTAERARSAITHRLRATIRRLEDEHPALGRHLDASVATGTYCTYRPEHPTTWDLTS